MYFLCICKLNKNVITAALLSHKKRTKRTPSKWSRRTLRIRYILLFASRCFSFLCATQIKFMRWPTILMAPSATKSNSYNWYQLETVERGSGRKGRSGGSSRFSWTTCFEIWFEWQCPRKLLLLSLLLLLLLLLLLFVRYLCTYKYMWPPTGCPLTPRAVVLHTFAAQIEIELRTLKVYGHNERELSSSLSCEAEEEVEKNWR